MRVFLVTFESAKKIAQSYVALEDFALNLVIAETPCAQRCGLLNKPASFSQIVAICLDGLWRLFSIFSRFDLTMSSIIRESPRVVLVRGLSVEICP